MRAINTSSVEKVIKAYQSDINDQSKALNTSLTELLKTMRKDQYKRYIEKLINAKAQIITANPDKIARLKRQFDRIIKLDKTKDKEFREKILKALGYSARRSDLYPKYFNAIGIKACVYCNSQLCVTVEDIKKKLVAKFQVDHFLPKETYPCFSVTLFNLYPVCASCNNKKGVKLNGFQLYKNISSTEPSSYSFELENHDTVVPAYINNRDPKILKVLFKEPATTAGHKTSEELFAISGIYNTQIDLVEELILKKEIYNTAYKQQLLNTFGNIFNDMEELNRIIVGNYIEEEELHKRPMAKFTQDIAKKLGLI